MTNASMIERRSGFSFFTLLILCVQAVVFWIQAKRLKETIKAMQKIAMDQSKDMQGWIAVADKSASAARKSADAFAATETAWAMEKIINVDFREFLPGTADADQKKVSVEYYVENYGRTPAIITSHFVDVRISDSPPPAENECFSKEIGNEYQIGVIDSGNNAALFPCARKAINLTKAQINGLARASLYLWVARTHLF